MIWNSGWRATLWKCRCEFAFNCLVVYYYLSLHWDWNKFYLHFQIALRGDKKPTNAALFLVTWICNICNCNRNKSRTENHITLLFPEKIINVPVYHKSIIREFYIPWSQGIFIVSPVSWKTLLTFSNSLEVYSGINMLPDFLKLAFDLHEC